VAQLAKPRGYSSIVAAELAGCRFNR